MAKSDEINDVTGFYRWITKWKKELEALGEAYTTSKREFAEGWWKIHERRENADTPLPDGVVERRQLNDSLHEMNKKLDTIANETKKSTGILKSWANSVKQFAKDLRE